MNVIIFDVANILFRAAAKQQLGSANQFNQYATKEDLVGLSVHVTFQSIAKWHRQFPSDLIVFAFEGDNNWRKIYTKANTEIRRQYKANRIYDPSMTHYYDASVAFKDLVTNYTSICSLTVPGMEGDDVISAFCELYSHPDNTIRIISGDKDYVQLLKFSGVQLVNPDNGKLRNQPGDKDYQSDINYWLFLKCIRGDSGDNVPSAFPKVRETKIKVAYEDSYARMNFMNETWTDENQKVQRVGDLFLHNEILMNLAKQPSEIRQNLLHQVKIQSDPKNFKQYSHFHFLKFLNKLELTNIASKTKDFIELFTHNQKLTKQTITTQLNEDLEY